MQLYTGAWSEPFAFLAQKSARTDLSNLRCGSALNCRDNKIKGRIAEINVHRRVEGLRVRIQSGRQQDDHTLGHAWTGVGILRSEEHTSELQSLRHLVCRLL